MAFGRIVRRARSMAPGPPQYRENSTLNMSLRILEGERGGENICVSLVIVTMEPPSGEFDVVLHKVNPLQYSPKASLDGSDVLGGIAEFRFFRNHQISIFVALYIVLLPIS